MNTERFYIDRYDEFYSVIDNFDDGQKYMKPNLNITETPAGLRKAESLRKTGKIGKNNIVQHIVAFVDIDYYIEYHYMGICEDFRILGFDEVLMGRINQPYPAMSKK